MEILKTLKDRCDPRYAALIVVDVQNDFVSPEGSAGKRGASVLPRVGRSLLRPLPLWERASMRFNDLGWVRGCSFTPHPFFAVETPNCPLPQGERARDAGAAFVTQ